METYDVREIRDIPNIENYFDKVFNLNLYDRSDNIQVYRLDLDDNKSILIDIIEDEKLIEGSSELVDIITRENITFLGYSIVQNETDILESYHYRPLIDEYEKKYLK